MYGLVADVWSFQRVKMMMIIICYIAVSSFDHQKYDNIREAGET